MYFGDRRQVRLFLCNMPAGSEELKVRWTSMRFVPCLVTDDSNMCVCVCVCVCVGGITYDEACVCRYDPSSHWKILPSHFENEGHVGNFWIVTALLIMN